ncbi:PLP-dependent aminotransferase family protein [Actinospica sp. MGRD01-02]|uniref:PLP-dependent aminotransferase family protein n=1 Tax=Actinospica acidithermotolerans TaxID=2828514 RepID=A0A941E5F8_9ACTN|nr:PLP-dependent aminotransferase family protein [Actinospica acidithermotolerans]MBR7825451.1 PLP-dependent aminotransferase family protein [Actinospica acidithermotolerans]
MARDWATSSGLDLFLELLPGERRRDGLERALREAIQGGRLAAGERLPATRVLATELGLSRGTVSAAYDQLVAEGYLHARHGSGTTVAHVPHAAGHHIRRPAAKPRYDLRPGTGDMNAFPVQVWLRSMRRALTTAPSSAFGYADDLRGRPELRAALADYLGRARGVAATPERIVITSGYTQSLSLLTRVLAPTSRRVAMEDPGLPYHRELVVHAGGEPWPLPVDSLGADPSTLPADVRLLVTTPAHQYPTGVTLHPKRRRALIDWARSADAIVIEDDYDGEFRYDRQPVGALQAMAPDHVVYAGTCAKALAPALRLGWMVLPPQLVDPVLAELRLSTLETESPGQLALADLISTHGYDRQIRAGRNRHRRRRDLLVDAVAAFPALSAAGISAGQHILVSLPADGPDESEVIGAATRRGLALGGLAEHWHGSGRPDRAKGLVVGYGAPTEAGYLQAVGVLVDVLRGFYR